MGVLVAVSPAGGSLKARRAGCRPRRCWFFAAMLPWQFFSTALSEASNSLIGNANLISKIYFPRLIVPAGSVITSFVDFLISAAFLVVLMVWFRYCAAGWQVLLIPLFVALARLLASMGAGLWIAALMVECGISG